MALHLVIVAAGGLIACDSEVGGGPDVDAGPTWDAAGDASPIPDPMPEVYSTDRTLSPVTPYVAARLADIAGAAVMSDDVFAKVGASATVSLNFLHCFAGAEVDLDGRVELQAALTHFLGGDAAGTDPFQRQSLSATVGWSAGAAIAGDPSPLDQEVAALSPRFAIIMYGTNDIQLGSIYNYGANLFEIADQLIANGVIPVFTSIMPRDDSAPADAEVPRYNLVMRGVAQARQVPFIDFHRELVPLADHGLGGDGIHPSVLRDPGAMGCVLTAAGLAKGYNIRNLLTLQTLRRLLDVVVNDGEPPDQPQRSTLGTGTPTDPIVIDQLPFTDLRDTARSAQRNVDVYTGCGATQDESGSELTYVLELAQPIAIRAMVVDGAGVDVDLHLMSGGTTGADCVERNDRIITTTLAAGTHYFNLDTFVINGAALEGEYLFVVMEDN